MDTTFDFKSIDYSSTQTIRKLLEIRGLAINARFGQNFLINRGAREKIVSLLAATNNDTVWEIGPGLGAMTSLLIDNTAKLLLFEIDKGYVKLLNDYYGDKAIIVEGDFIHTSKNAFENYSKPDCILGNLPYNAASAIILNMIEHSIFPRKSVFTVQNEMADRLCAVRGSKEYSSFSILSQICFEIKKEGKLQSGSFYPAPCVDSAIIVLKPSDRIFKVENIKNFSPFLKGLFNSRRKTIKNQLSYAYGLTKLKMPEVSICEKILLDEGITLKQRPEEIDVDTMIKIVNNLIKASVRE